MIYRSSKYALVERTTLREVINAPKMRRNDLLASAAHPFGTTVGDLVAIEHTIGELPALMEGVPRVLVTEMIAKMEASIAALKEQPAPA